MKIRFGLQISGILLLVRLVRAFPRREVEYIPRPFFYECLAVSSGVFLPSLRQSGGKKLRFLTQDGGGEFEGWLVAVTLRFGA